MAGWGRHTSGGPRRRYRLDTSREVFSAETFDINQAHRALDQQQKNSHRCTVFVDSAFAIC